MCSITEIILLAFIMQRHANEQAANQPSDSHDAMHKLGDKLVDRFVDQGFNHAWSIKRADLEHTTFCKDRKFGPVCHIEFSQSRHRLKSCHLRSGEGTAQSSHRTKITSAAKAKPIMLAELGMDSEDESEDDIEVLRTKRIAQRKKAYEKKQQLLAQGHGTYEEMDEREFFATVAEKSPYAVICLYRKDFWLSDTVDFHLEHLAHRHLGTRFVKLDAGKCWYLPGKLNINFLPALVLIIRGIMSPSNVIQGPSELSEDITMETMEKILAEYGVIEGPSL